MTEKELEKAIAFTKKSKTQQRAVYFKIKQVVHEKRVSRLKLNMEEKGKKEKRNAEERERLLR